MISGMTITVGFLLLLVTSISCDYSCVCNYNVEKTIYSLMDVQSNTIGYMYEFDCKQQLELTQNTQGWLVIAFEHKIGFVKQDSQVRLQLCPGDPPTSDIVTTAGPSTSSKDTYTSDLPASQLASKSTTHIFAKTTAQSFVSSTTSSEAGSSPTTTRTTPRETSTSTSARQTTGSLVGTTTRLVVSTTQLAPVTHRTTNTSASIGSGNTALCSENLRQFAQKRGGILAQINNTCYVLIKQYKHWLQAELDCNSEGGHLVHISNHAEQMFLYSFLGNYFNHSVWLGLNDRNSESQFEWSSGQSFFFVNWANHTHFSDAFEDCVVMDMHIHDGKWDDRDCSFEVYPYICQYALAGQSGGLVDVTTNVPSPQSSLATAHSDGNPQLCPEQVKRTATIDGTVLGQYERGCYELYLNNKMSWEHAENSCQSKGGHLAHISNSQQQGFVEGFMQRHNPNHAVWLGLHDTVTEGSFQWTAGNSVEYTNWIPGHHDNTMGGHTFEDCVVFVPQRQGFWDDVHCGYQLFGPDSGEIHYAFCQYKIHTTGAIVG